MCGIAGILIPGSHSRPQRDQTARIVQAMLDAMPHRGPDGDGVWVADDNLAGLGHRRLAIIDLSPDANQPMTNASANIWVTFNGEIYNHAKLRKELEADGHVFLTDHSDTEVLVHGYRAWGLDGLVRRLDGMFAFALWDDDRRMLSLARDRIGIKPIYFTRLGGPFRFASEIKALLSDPSVPRDVDRHALGHYLSFMISPAPLTLFKGIYKLPAAHVMEVDASGEIQTRRYWDALPGNGAAATETAGRSAEELDEYFAEGIVQRLETAVEKRMMSDVPFGVFLSGGIDSSVNVALMSRFMDRPVDTFTVGFSDFTHLNELDHARRIAKEFNTNHHEVLIGSDDMQAYLQDLVHQQDEPIADWVCVPLYFVSKLARDSGVTVVQVGEGSDEQFCGYDSWMSYLNFHRRFWWPYRRFVPGPVRSAIGSMAARLTPSTRAGGAQAAEALSRAGKNQELFWSGANAFWDVHKSQVLGGLPIDEDDPWPDLAGTGLDLGGLGAGESGDVADAYFRDLDTAAPGTDYLNRMAFAEFRLRLPELLLMRVDKITMSTSLEGRVPFLDHGLVEFTMDIPMDVKIRNGIKKSVLKRAVNGVIPDEIIHRAKMGFAAPVADWLRGEFGRDAQNQVMASPLVADGTLSGEYVEDLFNTHRERRADHALHLWTLFNLTAWHDHWIAG